MPWFLGLAGVAYLIGATLFSAIMVVLSVRFFFDRGVKNARSLFMVSNLYLLTVMLLLVVDAS
jgi:heme O synthase-like polyprenyltransferase